MPEPSERRVFRLPDHEEMLRRLKEIDDGAMGNGAQEFYSLILEHAGQEFYSEGIACLLTNAVGELCRGRPRIVQAAILVVMKKRLDGFAEALVDDESIRKEVLTLLADGFHRH